jgi:hypothetical protein
VLSQPHAGACGFDTDGGTDAADVDGGTITDVSAETFEAEQDVEHDGEWWRHDNAGPAYLTPHSQATDTNPTSHL